MAYLAEMLGGSSFFIFQERMKEFMSKKKLSAEKKYHEILLQAAKASGWSLCEIARRCKRKGIPVSEVYLSKLSRGLCAPASDKINRAIVNELSLLTDITYEQLSLAAYKERIPKDVLQAIRKELLNIKV